MIALLALLACEPVRVEVNPTDETDAPDPRKDPAGWPSTIGGDRPARVVAPSNYDGDSMLPLVVVLHGYGANSTVQDMYLGLSQRVDTLGFVLVLPEGTKNSWGEQFWNATPACCDFEGTNGDDVGYLLGLVDEIEASMPLDTDRIGIVGHSNGGFMAHRMACEAPERISAIASLAGSTWVDESDCMGAEPVHVLQAHGTVDDTITYQGDADYPGAEETVQRWATKAGCTGSLAEVGSPADYDGSVGGDETHALRYDAGCGKDVALLRMEGSGHVPLVTDGFRDAFVGWVLEHPR